MTKAVETTVDLRVTPLSGSLGAEVRGLSLAHATPALAEIVTDLITEHLVLFFPEQHLTPDEHIAFGRLFGKLEGHPNLSVDSERPEFFELRATSGVGYVVDEWHSDLTCENQPSIFAILHMKTCPPFGGDTMWANMYKAYENLSAPMRDLCDGLTAIHNAGPHQRPDLMSLHPVVRTHPVTGRKSLFVNEHFTRRIVELSSDESDNLLAFLTRHATQNRFTVRYSWNAGTVAMWDNRCTQHHVLDDFEGERVLQRVTVTGDIPERAEPARYEPNMSRLTAVAWRDRPYIDFIGNHSNTTDSEG